MAPAQESPRDGVAGSAPDARALATITPVVLVGGRSRRFGRDKLREPVAGAAGAGGLASPSGPWLVDRPVAALRVVFGPRVAAVGECDPQVAARFDRIIDDRHPGAGPIGGIVSALAAAGEAEGDGGAVFVLAGDLGAITAAEVRGVLGVWQKRSGAPPAGCKPAPRGPAPLGQPAPLIAVMASTGRPEPCCALYLSGALPILRARLARGQHSLHDAIPPENVALAPLPPQRLANVNAPADLKGL